MISRFFGGHSSKKEDHSSEFSRFFRTAPSKKKKKVFMSVARSASADQKKFLTKECQ